MKLANLVGERFKERPSDCQIDSHALLVRGAYIKYVGSGIFSSFPPMKRITKKIEEIIRFEMDNIEGQEVSFPVVLPATLWEESGRYESVGAELLRFSDRNNSKHVLGMTHEEPCVQLVREYGQSYQRYPFMIYQIQTKFRDEARPRGGLIRVREFTMKDGYSFHTEESDLLAYYDRVHKAYENIFRKCGVPEVISVLSDSGMMGGSVSHEFMLINPVGEDSIVTCTNCDFKSNMEAAATIVDNSFNDKEEAITLVHTPDCKTIEDVCNFLGTDTSKSCKAVVYQKDSDNSFVILFTRGDYEVNEAKLKAVIKDSVHPAIIDENSGIVAGYIGGYKLDVNATVIYDSSLKDAANLVCGANLLDHHYTGFNIARDVGNVEYYDVSKAQKGGICPICSKESLEVSRGIEVGNIFQLGDKYTKSMDMTCINENGESFHPIMGCYGIGVGRLAASVCEARHDDYGPIWPMSIAPWQVHLCAVRADDEEVRKVADGIYNELKSLGVEVIFDDRTVSAGVMFSDADLLGVPLRVVVSPRNLKENCVEISTRDKSFSVKVPHEEAVSNVKSKIDELLAQLN